MIEDPYGYASKWDDTSLLNADCLGPSKLSVSNSQASNSGTNYVTSSNYS